jgi:hypothetical protein
VGIISTVAGKGLGFSGDGGPAVSAQISSPNGLATDKAGNLFIVDAGNRRVRKVNTAGIISTVAGSGNSGFSGDGGPATAATFSWGFNGHLGIAVDSGGSLYIPDMSNQRCVKWIPRESLPQWRAMESGTIQGMAVRPPAPDWWTRLPRQ